MKNLEDNCMWVTLCNLWKALYPDTSALIDDMINNGSQIPLFMLKNNPYNVPVYSGNDIIRSQRERFMLNLKTIDNLLRYLLR